MSSRLSRSQPGSAVVGPGELNSDSVHLASVTVRQAHGCVRLAKLTYVHTHLSQWRCRDTARTCVKRWLVSGSGHLRPQERVHTQPSVPRVGEGRMDCSQCPLPCPRITYPQATCCSRPGCKWGLGASRRAGEVPRGSNWVSKPRTAGEASPARKPLRRCPHYITDIPATRPATLRRGAFGNAKQDEAPPGRAAELAERLLLPAAAGGRFQPPAPGAAAGLREEGARAGRRRGRG